MIFDIICKCRKMFTEKSNLFLIMKKLSSLEGVSVLSKKAQKTVHGGGRELMNDCRDYCAGTVEANIFTGECFCVTPD